MEPRLRFVTLGVRDLARNVRSEAEADALMAEVAAGGGRFLWEVVWNPHFPHV